MENNKYEAAQKRILEWINSGILVKDKKPAFFVSRQKFQIGEKKYTRIGLISALRLYPYSEKIVFPHEVTYKEPKTDRTKMLESVQKDLEPVFLIYSDPEKTTIKFFSKIIKTSSILDFKDSSNIRHTIWKVSNPHSIKLITEALKDKILVIADGHHRYESALTYRDNQQKKNIQPEESAFNFHMTYIVPVEESGLVVLPTHRALKGFDLTSKLLNKLSDYFSLQPIDPKTKFLELFLKKNSRKHAFCICNGSNAYGLILKNEFLVSKIINKSKIETTDLLDVTILHDLIFKRIMGIGKMKMHKDILYAETTNEALEKLESGEAKLVFLVNPVDPKAVWKIAQKNWRLPEKSTDFYPKPSSGLMMMDISVGEVL
jgi:uncharacterized protein (DUF1015 family)